MSRSQPDRHLMAPEIKTRQDNQTSNQTSTQALIQRRNGTLIKLTTADTTSIWNDITNYLSMTVDILKMAIKILDRNRIAAGGQKNQYTPYDAQKHRTDHSGHHVALFLLLRWSPKLSFVCPRKSLQPQKGKNAQVRTRHAT